jgi:hypothetical protein
MPIVYVTQFGGSIACGVIIAMVPAFSERKKVRTPATCVPHPEVLHAFQQCLCRIWLVTEAVADLGVAAALLWEFRKAKRNLGETRFGRHQLYGNAWLIIVTAIPNSVLDRLVALTIRTGTATATLAVATLIA